MVAPPRQLSSCMLFWLQNLSYANKSWEHGGVRVTPSGLSTGEKHPTALPPRKRVKAPPSPVLCRTNSLPEGLDSPAVHFGLPEACSVFMNSKDINRSISICCALPTEQERKEKRMKLSSPPSLPFQARSITPHLL